MKTRTTTTTTTAANIVTYVTENGKTAKRRAKSAYCSALAMTAKERAAVSPWRVEVAKANRDRRAEDATATAYGRYSADAWNAVSYLHSKTPTPLLQDLMRGLMQDSKTRNAAALAMLADAEQEKHNEAREDYAEYMRIANSLTAAEADRTAAAIMARAAHTTAATATEHAAALDELTAEALTLAADLVQAAALADLEPPTDTDFRAAQKTLAQTAASVPTAADDDTAGNMGTLIEYARKAHRRAAVKAYIRGEKGINALDGNATSYKAATAEDVTAWREKYADNAEEAQPTKGGTKALIWREADPKHGVKAGYYFKYVSKTYRQANSYEQLTTREDGEGNSYTDETIVTSANVYIVDQGGAERIEALASRASITERESDFLAAFCSRPAIRAGAEARAEYHTEHGERATEAGASAAEFASRKAYSFHRIGINTDTNRRKFYSRLTKKLKAAGAPTEPRQYAPRDFEHFRRMMQSNHGNRYNVSAYRADMLTWTERTAGATAAHTITWTAAGWTEAEQERTAAKLAELAKDSHIDNSTESARATAAAAHIRYLIANATADRTKVYSLTAAELLDILKRYTKHRTAAERKAKARAKAAAEAAARAAEELANRERRRITVTAWNSYTAAQRLEIIRNERFTIIRG